MGVARAKRSPEESRMAMMYSHMKARVSAKRYGIPLPFDLDGLRAWMLSPDRCRLQSWQCAYCKRWLVLEEVQLEHVVPLARGGGAGLDNLVIACQKCNRMKGEFTAEEYFALIGWTSENFQPAAESYLLKCLSGGGQSQRLRFARGEK